MFRLIRTVRLRGAARATLAAVILPAGAVVAMAAPAHAALSYTNCADVVGNKLTNCGFETAGTSASLPGSWTLVGDGLTKRAAATQFGTPTINQHSGGFGLALADTGAGGSVAQTVAVGSGLPVTVGLWIAGNETDSSTKVKIEGLGASTGTALLGTVAGGTKFGWTYYEYAFTSGSSGSVGVKITGITNDWSFMVDDVALTVVEPEKSPQAALSINQSSGTAGTPLPLTTTGGSGTGAVSYSATSGTAGCTVNGTNLSATSAGTCAVTATKAGDSTYDPISSSATTIAFAAPKLEQSALTVTSTSGTFNAPLSLTSSGGSGTGEVSYAPTPTAGDTTTCTVTSGQASSTGAGTCSITATKAGDATYNSVSSSSTIVTFAKSAQESLAITSLNGTYGTPLTLTASGGSGTGNLFFGVTNPSSAGCSITSGVLSATGVGDCYLAVTKFGDTNYLERTAAPQLVTIAKATQASITLTSVSGTYGSPLPLAISGGSGTGAVTYSVTSSGTAGCSALLGSLTSTQAGTCSVTASKAGDSNYNDASSTPTTVTIAKASQSSLTLTSRSGLTSSALALTTSGGSGLGAVTFELVSGDVAGCNLVGSVLTAASAGTCTVIAHKATDERYLEASSVATPVTFITPATVAPGPFPTPTPTSTGSPTPTPTSTPPSGLTSPQDATAASGPVTSTNTDGRALTTSAEGGSGSVHTGWYPGVPSGTTALGDGHAFFDIFVTPGSSLTKVTTRLCGADADDVIQWFDPTSHSWKDVSNQSFNPADGCITVTITTTSSPSLAQLTGTVLSLVHEPETVAPTTLVLSHTTSGGKVNLIGTTSPALKGKAVVFYLRSGLTGKVVPLGQAIVDGDGKAVRTLALPKGRILAIYARVPNTATTSLYSNTQAFKVG